MKNKQFIKIGYISLGLMMSLSLSGCKYNNQDEILQTSDNQTSVVLVLGDTHTSTIYNVKKEQDVYLHAPSGYKILLNGKEEDFYKKHINPQEIINLKFTIKNTETNKTEEVEKLVITYKEPHRPKYQVDIMEKSGKSNYDVGDINYFSLGKNQKETIIELHEFNKGKKHEFIYVNGQNNLKIKLLAPKYHSFVFNGKSYKEYNTNVNKSTDTSFSMTLKPDWSEETYQRQYKFKLK